MSIWFDIFNNLDGCVFWYFFVIDKVWENNLFFIGNGSLGGNVMGFIVVEWIILNEKILWCGGLNIEKGVVYYWNVNKELVYLLFEIC